MRGGEGGYQLLAIGFEQLTAYGLAVELRTIEP